MPGSSSEEQFDFTVRVSKERRRAENHHLHCISLQSCGGTHAHTHKHCVRVHTSKADTQMRNLTRTLAHTRCACVHAEVRRTHAHTARERATPCLVTTLLELTLCVRMRPSLDQTKPSANVRGFLFYTVYGGFILYIGHAPTVLGR